MSATTEAAAAASAPPPATLQAFVGAVAEQIQKAPPTDRAWKIAGFNVGNLWAIVLLAIAYLGPKLEAAHTRVMAGVDALPRLTAAITELAETTRLSTATLQEMRDDNRRLKELVDRAVSHRLPEPTP